MGSLVAVLGATGVYGRHLVPRLVAAGHRVRALVRRPESAAVVAALGADMRLADVFDGASLRAALDGCDVGVHLATSLPGPSGRGDYAANDRLRREGTPVWVAACRAAGVARVLQQSVALVNAGSGDAVADEDTRFAGGGDDVASRAIAAALEMEDTVRRSGLDAMILRGGLFYGPGTGFDDDWFARARTGKLRLPGDGSDWVSLVHVADMAQATLTALTRWRSGDTLIVADDEPVRWRDLFGWIAAIVGGAAPSPGGRIGFPSWRVSNRRARDRLGWTPVYPNYRVGLAR